MKAKTALTVLSLLLVASPLEGQDSPSATASPEILPDTGLVFPGVRWSFLEDADEYGWDVSALRQVENQALEVGSSAGLIVWRGAVIASWGEVTKRENSQSMRKSLVSGLIGSLVAEGEIDLDDTLGELGIQDEPPLTEGERSATVRDLLHSRSGVYHSAVYEFPDAKDEKPERGTYEPGEHFFYNNWDFNVVETLAERAAGQPLGQAFHTRIAEPIGTQDFRPEDIEIITDRMISERFMGNDSEFPAHVFMISARDLARYGLLYLAEGQWDGREVLPREWVAESIAGLPTQRDIEYGYLWWVDPDGTWFSGPSLEVRFFFGRGNRGHYVLAIPSLQLVVVNRVETGGSGLFAQLRRRVFGSGRVRESDFADVLRAVIAAHPSAEGQSGGE